jgi:predicted metal-dependent hydrolase
MNETIYVSLIIIILYIIYIYNKKNNFIYAKSVSGNNYIINKDEFQNVKVELLDKIQYNMYKLKEILLTDIKKYPEYTSYILQLDKNFNKQRTLIYETDFNSNLTSYSVNKGEELSICLKSKKTGNFHDINLLMYVIIHEMSHFACPEIGHGALFKKIFKKFIEVAIEYNLYKYENYDEHPIEYCGMELNSSII